MSINNIFKYEKSVTVLLKSWYGFCAFDLFLLIIFIYLIDLIYMYLFIVPSNLIVNFDKFVLLL